MSSWLNDYQIQKAEEKKDETVFKHTATPGQFRCPKCGKPCPSKNARNNHLRECRGTPYGKDLDGKPHAILKKQETFKCNCGQVLRNQFLLNIHCRDLGGVKQGHFHVEGDE